MTSDVGSWIAVFRLLGEIKHSCREAEDDLNHALKQVASLHKYVMSLDEVLMHKYNIESTPKEKSND